MPKSMVLILLMLIAVVGCTSEEEKIAAEEPPPPTPEEIARAFIQKQSLTKPLPPPDILLPLDFRNTYINDMRQFKNLNSGTPEGQEAIHLVSNAVDKRAVNMYNNDIWDPMLLLVDVHLVFNPGSTQFEYQQEKAIIELKKPKITCKGFFDNLETGTATGFFDFHLPLEHATYSEKIMVGDEVHGVRFIEIIGNNKGGKFEYLETREILEAIRE